MVSSVSVSLILLIGCSILLVILSVLLFGKHYVHTTTIIPTALLTPSTITTTQPSPTQYTMKKKVMAQWNWSYTWNDNANIQVRQICPTLHHDAGIFVDNKLLARTMGKIASTSSTVKIVRSDDVVLYTLTTSGIVGTILNNIQQYGGTFDVYVQDVQKNNEKIGIVHYSYTPILDSVTIFEPNTAIPVVVASRNKVTLSSWTWNINVYSQPYPSVSQKLHDPLLISLLLGKISFHSNENTDLCNSTYILLCVVFGILIVVFVCAFVALILPSFSNRWPVRREDPRVLR